MPAGKFNSLSYAPYRAWQSPLDKTYPTAAQVAEDLQLVAQNARGIRTYSAIEGDYDIGALAQQAGLHVWLGIWLSSNGTDNAKEIAAGIAEANAHPDTITRVIVGNEVLLRRDLSVEALISDLDYVRARVKQPIAYADVTDFWRQFPQVAPHVDIVMIHFLPYWEDEPLGVDTAIQNIKTTTDEFKNLFPAKQISIGETGWPSRGRWRQSAAPSRVNEAVFLRAFVSLADREGVDYNLIEAFDQNWKYADEGVAGANWGIWSADRVQKFPLADAVTEHPDWPWYAGLGALSAVLLLIGAGKSALRMALPAFALGNAFALASLATLPMLYNSWLWVDALVNLPLQALFAVLTMRRIADFISGGQGAGISGAQTLAAVRRGRLPICYDAISFIFLVSAAVFEALLVFDGRYRDAPIPVFAIPIVAAALRLRLSDAPMSLGWEETLAAATLAILALADILVEGPANLDFLLWNIGALIMAAPYILVLAKRLQKPAVS